MYVKDARSIAIQVTVFSQLSESWKPPIFLIDNVW